MAERAKMAALGLERFETATDCLRNQVYMSQRVVRFGKTKHFDVADCTADHCAASQCSEGCYFGARRRRIDTISTAHAMMIEHGGPFFQVTFVHPSWKYRPGKLDYMNIPAMRQFNARILKGLAIEGLLAVGICEATLNVERSGARHWAGEIQQVVAGADKASLAAAFAIKNRSACKAYERPVMVKKITNLGLSLGYAQKYFVQQRIAFTSRINGRQAQRHMPLRSADWAEHDAWLLSLPLGDRTIAFGCVRRGQMLYPLK
jgi:hypothetical protein